MSFLFAPYFFQRIFIPSQSHPLGKEILANPIPLLSLAPYERRVIELLRNSKDKRARKLAKKRVRFPPFSSIAKHISITTTRPPASRF